MQMKVTKWVFMFLLFEVSLFSYVQAQEIIVYPAKGQSNDQMEKDKFECYTWARDQTGFDPMQVPTASSPPPSQERRSVGGSTLGGGLLGGAGGDGKKELVSRISRIVKSTQGEDYDAFIQAESRAVAALGKEIADAIKSKM
jgi:hypothetical protein